MSYCVEYNPELKEHYPFTQKPGKKPSVRILVLGVVLAVSAYGIFSSGILRFLIPGDPEITSTAFSGLMKEIGEGEPIADAVMTFCRDVIVNGK